MEIIQRTGLYVKPKSILMTDYYTDSKGNVFSKKEVYCEVKRVKFTYNNLLRVIVPKISKLNQELDDKIEDLEKQISSN